jgi:hypothetical protein
MNEETWSESDPVTVEQPARFKFGVGEDEWSACNPRRFGNALSEQIAAMTEGKLFTARELLTDYLYLIETCPTTELACEKLRAIRRAMKRNR